MDLRYLDSIRRFEGFTSRARWDYAQHTNGYGTKARHAGEVITPGEAERRFRDEVGRAAAMVERFAPHLDSGTRAALTSLTFNAGPRWMQSGLGAAIKANDLAGARSIFVQYAKAGGEVLPGLLARRVEEAGWFGSEGAEAPATSPAAPRAVAAEEGLVFAGREPREATPGLPYEVLALWEQIRIDHVRMLTLRKGEEASA